MSNDEDDDGDDVEDHEEDEDFDTYEGLDKPHIDFGHKFSGVSGDLMSIPGLYRLVQNVQYPVEHPWKFSMPPAKGVLSMVLLDMSRHFQLRLLLQMSDKPTYLLTMWFGEIEANVFSSLTRSIPLRLRSDRDDEWVWSPDREGLFSVKSVRELFEPQDTETSAKVFPRCKIQPIKVNVFGWRLWLGRLQTKVCEEAAENVDHLFSGCRYTHLLWEEIKTWCRLDGLLCKRPYFPT